MKPQSVTVYDIRHERTRKRPFLVSWRVGSGRPTRAFQTKAQAQVFHASLWEALRRGELFQVETPYEPVSWAPVPLTPAETTTVHDLAYAWYRSKWDGWAATSRAHAWDGVRVLLLNTLTAKPYKGFTEDAKKVYAHRKPSKALFPDFYAFVGKHSLPLSKMDIDATEKVLNACAATKDGVAAKNTLKHRVRVIEPIFEYAVTKDLLTYNPVSKALKTWTAPRVTTPAVKMVLYTPVEVRKALETIRGHNLYPWLYIAAFAGLRPSEINGLRWEDIELPDEGWGVINLRRAVTTAGTAYTDDGKRRETKGLKHREIGEERTVPIPPELVAVLKSKQGKGALYPKSTSTHNNNRVWRQAQTNAGLKQSARVYDLRHCNATWLLNTISIAETARRLGHSPEVLLRVYSGVLSDDLSRANTALETFYDR